MSNYLINSVDLPVNSDTFKYKDDAIAPNGVKEAARFENTENKGSIITPAVSSALIITNSKFYCRSVFVKSAGVNSVIIPFVFSTSDNSLNRWVVFNINTKTISYSHPSDPDCYANYKEYDNGWIRFWVTVEKIAERTISQNWYIGGYGTSSNKHKFWAWGAQFEEVATLNSEPGEYELKGASTPIFYNRDSNINVSQPITRLTYQPSYGSRVTFSSNLNKYETSDGYYNSIPLSINSLRAKFDLKYDLNEEESKKLVNFIENKNGVYDITFSDPSSVYKNIDGFCTEYAINCINKNHYEVALSLEVNESPNLFNWYSMNFVNSDFKNWNFNTYYNKYDILYQNNLNNLNNLFKNSENFKKTTWWLDNIECNFHKNILNPFDKYEAYSIQATPTLDLSLIGGHSLWPIKYFNNEYVWDDLLEKVPNLAKKMTFSIFIKPNNKFKFQLGIEYAAKKTSDPEINPRTSANYVRFNLNNLTLSSGGGKATGSIIQYKNGWYRCVVTADVENEYFIPILTLLSNNEDTHVYQPIGNTDGSLYIWGAQVQEELTDYIKTDSFPITPNKLNNFYYCSADHNSKQGIDSQPQDSLSYWRQDFFFEPDIGIQNSVNLKISKLNLKNSFSQNIKTQKNIAALNLTYKFTNITTQKAKAILHFLENKGGYRRFRVNMDSVYNKPKVFYAPSWTHTWKYEDSHDIEVELIEDPMGVIPKD